PRRIRTINHGRTIKKFKSSKTYGRYDQNIGLQISKVSKLNNYSLTPGDDGGCPLTTKLLGGYLGKQMRSLASDWSRPVSRRSTE
ncbi:unnamed protein product, partial [Ascophyllum nodosum]